MTKFSIAPAVLLCAIGTGYVPDAEAARAFPVGRSIQRITLDGTRFEVHTYKPKGTIRGVLLVYHGTDRNADDYRYRAERLANKHGLVVAVPLFDEARFPSSAYNRGNVKPGSSPSTWTTRFVPLLVKDVKAREGVNLPTYIFGFSAGGQFISRVAAFENLTGVTRIVSGGASTYVLPTTTEQAAYGFGGLTNQDPAAYLIKPYSIIVGTADNDPNAPNLTDNAAARRQGTNRLDRARFTFQMAKQEAEQRGIPLAWTYHEVPDVAHSSSRILRSKELQEAFGLPNPAPL